MTMMMSMMMTDHSWTRATIYHTPAPDQPCAYCGLPANTPNAGRVPCTPPKATPEDVAWSLREYMDRIRRMQGNRPYPAAMMEGEFRAARLRLHRYLDANGLAGSEYDDRRVIAW